MTKAAWNLFLIFLIYQQILTAQFNMPRIYGFWDELVFLVIALIAVLEWVNKSSYRLGLSSLKSIMPWIALVGVGLVGNILYRYAQNTQAIIRDIIGFLKFPLGFYAVQAIGIDSKIARSFRSIGSRWVKVITIIILAFGILSLFTDIGMSQSSIRGGIHPYQFLFNHPTALVFAAVVSICLLNATEKNNENIFYLLTLSLIIILSMRTKGIAFVAVFIFMKYGGIWLKRVKILYGFGICVAILAASYSKLMMYASWSDSGREMLYVGAFDLMVRCFPFGSGFGTYASHLSGRYQSGVYSFIYHYQFWNSDGTATAVLGDAGIPYYIGQFGFIGVFLMIFAVYRMLKVIVVRIKGNNLSLFLLWIYLAIALTSEAILITYGIELAVILAVVFRLQADAINLNKNRNRGCAYENTYNK